MQRCSLQHFVLYLFFFRYVFFTSVGFCSGHQLHLFVVVAILATTSGMGILPCIGPCWGWPEGQYSANFCKETFAMFFVLIACLFWPEAIASAQVRRKICLVTIHPPKKVTLNKLGEYVPSLQHRLTNITDCCQFFSRSPSFLFEHWRGFVPVIPAIFFCISTVAL